MKESLNVAKSTWNLLEWKKIMEKLLQFRSVIKSPRYTGGDYVFVPVSTPPAPAADSCSHDNFWTFWISFILGMIVGPDL